jgi:hemolysin activation/secretion protein
MLFLALGTWTSVQAAETSDTTNAPARFNVTAYVVVDNGLMPTNVSARILSKYTGPGVSLQDIVKGASELQSEYRNRGYPSTSIAIAQDQITNGIVTLNVFQTAIPQIVVSGVRYYSPTNAAGALASSVPAIAPAPLETAAASVTNAPPIVVPPQKPASREQIEQAYASLMKAMSEPEKPPDTRIHVIPGGSGPTFDVDRYRIMGNTILSPQDLAMILTNIDGDYGTNVSIDGIRTVVQQLQAAYKDRGYITVAVGIPQQKLTNATVKIKVTEGVLSVINVEGNHYFSSNNVMRALPSLHTNMLLNANVLQAELNRANANQDRQIYPIISPGPEPGTSALTLHVKDQLPVHAKLDLNNQSSPGTPSLRVNGSAVDNNLWQQEQSLGVQYGFSPELMKSGPQWDFYDKPSVADYSAFYRIPLGSAESVENTLENNNNPKFGYDEATRQFNLPPTPAQPTLSVYASRATIDTGIVDLFNGFLVDEPGTNVLQRTEVQQGITINEDIGFQLSKPLPPMGIFQSFISGGLDFKIYSQQNTETNIFTQTQYFQSNGVTIATPESIYSAMPEEVQTVRYLPLQLGYNANWIDWMGPASAGLTLSANLWFISSTTYGGVGTNPVPATIHGIKSLQGVTGSGDSSGNWVILKPSFSQNIVTIYNWITSFRADGQWASEPLISNEQFGIGGVNSVRGYHEGEIFGDTGWHVSLEEDTPQHIVGTVYDGQPLSIRGLAYFDAATAYRLDQPAGTPYSTTLAGTGFGINAAVGTHFTAQFLFSLPLFNTPITERYRPFFNFDLTGQF